MKKYTLIVGPLIIVTLLSCQRVFDPNSNIEAFNCNALYQGLLDNNLETVRSELTIIFNDLPPKPISNDAYGHRENFDTLIDQLNNCNAISAELSCYCCLKSNPPQSIVSVTIDSSGTEIVRNMDILTPSDNYLSCWAVY